MKPTSSALRSALLVFLSLLIASCSPAARNLFFDIPPKKPANEVRNESQQPASEQSAPGTVATNQVSQLGHPSDSEVDRPAIESTLVWSEALEMLPKDSMGQPDWSAALRDEVIRPRALDPADREAEVFKLDFYLKSANPMFDAWFPHTAHLQWMGCASCRPAVFKYRDNPMTMAAINKGEYCGTCHGKVAFAATACKRCHLNMP